MKIAVAGKGGAGKTTVSGTLARALARSGHEVLALDADANPMLGISLGVGPEQTDVLVAARQELESDDAEHETTMEGVVERFGADAPDGVRLVVVSRIEGPGAGCQCCGLSPNQMMSELEERERVVLCDLEAGVGAVVRAGNADVVLVVANPTAKSIEVARRAVAIAKETSRVIVVANRVASDEDLADIEAVVGGEEMVVIPEDRGIANADRDGEAPLDAAPDSAGVAALVDLAARVAGAAPQPV